MVSPASVENDVGVCNLSFQNSLLPWKSRLDIEQEVADVSPPSLCDCSRREVIRCFGALMLPVLIQYRKQWWTFALSE